MIETVRFSVGAKAGYDILDITDKVQEILSESKAKAGIVTVFVPGATASVSTIEFEPGLVKSDVPALLEKLAPLKKDYAHHGTWGDDNGGSHVRSTLMGPGIVVPFENSRLILGQWQQICLLDFDTRSREREVVVQVMGE